MDCFIGYTLPVSVVQRLKGWQPVTEGHSTAFIVPLWDLVKIFSCSHSEVVTEVNITHFLVLEDVVR